MGTPSDSASAFQTCRRAAFFFLGSASLVTLNALLFMVDALTPVPLRFSEIGCVETAQIAMLLLAMCAFAQVARSDLHRRTLATLFCSMLLVALIRELDWITDMIRHGSWKLPALIVACATLLNVWPRRRDLLPALAELCRTPAWGLLCGGFLTVMIYSRLIGYKAVWIALVSEAALRLSIKRAAEEGTELLGYTLIVCGAWAFLRQGSTDRPPKNGSPR